MKLWLKRLALIAGVLALIGLVMLEGLRFAARRSGVESVELPRGSRVEDLAVDADYTDAYRVPLACEGLDIDELFPPGLEGEAARSPDEFVFRGTAPGLHYLASYVVDQSGYFTLGTAVFYDSPVGVVYFTPVKYVHRRVVPFAVSRQAKGWCAGR